jgi:hypothetical protein
LAASRKRRSSSGGSGGEGDLRRGSARSRERDESVRAQLEPLAPGERPRAVTVAAVLAGLIALANVVLLLAGWEVQGEEVQPTGVLLFAGLMLAAAAGMWQCRYWAVLGFQALLGISIVFSSLSLLVASNLQAALISTLLIVVAGTLFWFLVRAMARLKMPERPARGGSGTAL